MTYSIPHTLQQIWPQGPTQWLHPGESYSARNTLCPWCSLQAGAQRKVTPSFLESKYNEPKLCFSAYSHTGSTLYKPWGGRVGMFRRSWSFLLEILCPYSTKPASQAPSVITLYLKSHLQPEWEERAAQHYQLKVQLSQRAWRLHGYIRQQRQPRRKSKKKQPNPSVMPVRAHS